MRRLRLAGEFALIFAGGPLVILWCRSPGVLFALLWLGALAAWRATAGRAPSPHDGGRRELRRVLIRFAVLAPLITLAVWLWLPQEFLTMPRHRPLVWVAVMLLYPLLSVWPQEMLYRRLLFARYRPLLRSDAGLVAASALAFGFAHILFLNWIAIAMTTVGGALFARDYARHRSLRLVCLEHALFGCLIFTVGLGRFFYTGAAWRH